MENTTFMQSNYIDNYNALQLSLPINLGLKIESNDEVVSFLKALEGVNLKKFLVRKEPVFRSSHYETLEFYNFSI